MSFPLVRTIFMRQVQAMIAREIVISVALSDAWRGVWHSLSAALFLLEYEINDAVAEGRELGPSFLESSLAWTIIQTQVEGIVADWVATSERVLVVGQREVVRAAQMDALALLDALDVPAAGTREAAELRRWLTALDPRSPLHGSLARYGTVTRATLLEELTAAIAEGRPWRETMRRLEARLGPDAMQPHIETLVRTEMERAYRGAQMDTYEPLRRRGLIDAYQWVAQVGPGTCGACLAMHGRVFAEYPEGFHPNCRCRVRPIVAGTTPRDIDDAEAWLREQDGRTQLVALGSRGRVDAFGDGMGLEQMVLMRPNAVWGPSVGLAAPGAGGSLPGRRP